MQRLRARVLEKIRLGRNMTVVVRSVKDGQVEFGIKVPRGVKVFTEEGEVVQPRRHGVSSRRKYH